MTEREGKLYKVDLYEEKYWEVHNPTEAKIVAHFFDGELAKNYVEWLNGNSGG